MIDPLGNVSEVQIDALGRPTVMIDANGVASKLGRRDWSKDGAGRVTAYGYDASGRLATRLHDMVKARGSRHSTRLFRKATDAP